VIMLQYPVKLSASDALLVGTLYTCHSHPVGA
jgi:hypothetical protein